VGRDAITNEEVAGMEFYAVGFRPPWKARSMKPRSANQGGSSGEGANGPTRRERMKNLRDNGEHSLPDILTTRAA